METFFGLIKTPVDALIIFEGKSLFLSSSFFHQPPSSLTRPLPLLPLDCVGLLKEK